MKKNTLPGKNIIFCLFLSAIVITAYSSAFSYPFINYDTENYLLKNSRMVNHFSWMNIPWAFTTMETGDWHPFIWLVFFLIRSLFGLTPLSFHAANILLHTVNALFVFLSFQYATKRTWESFALALMFAVHPLRVESVVWVSELKDVLSGFFWWLTIGSYLYAHIEKKRNVLNWTLGFYVCGILSKPIVVSIPFIFLLLDYWPLERFRFPSSFSKIYVEKIPFLILAIFSATMAIVATAGVDNIRSLEAVPLSLRFSNAMISYVTYIWKTIYPFKLAIFYPFPHESAKSFVLVLLAFTGLCIVSFHAIKLRRTAPFIFVGWFWYLITHIPTIGLLRVSSQAMADRYTYLPSIGLGLIVIWGGAQILSKYRRFFPAMTGVCVFIYFFACTKQQVRFWETPITLNQHALEMNPENYIAASNLGYIYLKQHHYDRAADYLRQSLQASVTPEALSNYGLILMTEHKYQEAEKLFSSTLASYRSRDADVYYKFGLILLHNNKKNESMTAFLKSLSINKNFLPSLKMLSELYLESGLFEKAQIFIDRSLDIDPNDGVSNWHKGFLAERSGNVKQALVYYEKSLLAPRLSNRAISRWIVLCAAEGDLTRIKRVTKEIIQRHPDSILPYLILSQVLFSEQKGDEAQLYLSKLLQIHPGFPDAIKLLEQNTNNISENISSDSKISPSAVVSNIDDLKLLFDAVANSTSRAMY